MNYDILPGLWRVTREEIFNKLIRLEKNYDIMGIEISPIKNRKSITIELKLKRVRKDSARTQKNI